jgi:alkanesulfonate monooxygenase SsuD/methylene tetrahydromethanopterin reductase-like flavin-dependent oxidoreductase (luciferase family)
VAAKHATDYNQIASVEEVREGIARFREICGEIGRDPSELRYSVQVQIKLSDDKAEVDRHIDGVAKIYADGASHRISEHYPSVEAQVRDSMLWGGTEEMKEQVGRWTDAGINHFILMTPRPFDAAMMERFAKEVVPAFS